MSRYKIQNVFDFFGVDDATTDSAGFSLKNWRDFGVVGWDDGLYTYFIQLDMGNDEPEWWFGNSFAEILSPYATQALLSRLFNIEPPSFNPVGLNALERDRKAFVKKMQHPEEDEREILIDFSLGDQCWVTGAFDHDKFTQEYMDDARGMFDKV